MYVKSFEELLHFFHLLRDCTHKSKQNLFEKKFKDRKKINSKFCQVLQKPMFTHCRQNHSTSFHKTLLAKIEKIIPTNQLWNGITCWTNYTSFYILSKNLPFSKKALFGTKDFCKNNKTKNKLCLLNWINKNFTRH